MPESSEGTLNVQFRGGDLLPVLQSRSGRVSPGQIARRDLERYYALLRDELRAVDLTEREASLICDVCNGTLWEPHTYRLLWASIDEAIRLDNVDAKWDVDAGALVTKLRGLTPGQTLAVIDAAERFWTAPNDGPDRLRVVGLVKEIGR